MTQTQEVKNAELANWLGYSVTYSRLKCKWVIKFGLIVIPSSYYDGGTVEGIANFLEREHKATRIGTEIRALTYRNN